MPKTKEIKIDTKSGSMAYNRLNMQLSQALHMAIELFPNINYLLVLDHYDDITVFDSDTSPAIVSYYQLKTSEESISIDTAISEEWITKLYTHLDKPEWMVEELSLVTNCPLKVTVTFKDVEGKTRREEKNYSAEKTSFSEFDHKAISKIKNDIASRLGIAPENIDLSKFVHMRTTLSIPMHHQIVEQEMGDFLYKQYPKITIDSVKTIFASMMDLLSKRQSYEHLNPDAPFVEVRKHKGVSKEEFSRIISQSIAISIPPFEEIEQMINFANDEDKHKAAYEYSRLCSDTKKGSESFDILHQQVHETCSKNTINDDEIINAYVNRIYSLLPAKNPIYNKDYVLVLICIILINEWRCNQ